MSRISDLTTLRIGKYQTWTSYWYENSTIHTPLFFIDLNVEEFVRGLYYKLEMPCESVLIRTIGSELLLIQPRIMMINRPHKCKSRYLFEGKLNISVMIQRLLTCVSVLRSAYLPFWHRIATKRLINKKHLRKDNYKTARVMKPKIENVKWNNVRSLPKISGLSTNANKHLKKPADLKKQYYNNTSTNYVKSFATQNKTVPSHVKQNKIK